MYLGFRYVVYFFDFVWCLFGEYFFVYFVYVVDMIVDVLFVFLIVFEDVI